MAPSEPGTWRPLPSPRRRGRCRRRRACVCVRARAPSRNSASWAGAWQPPRRMLDRIGAPVRFTHDLGFFEGAWRPFNYSVRYGTSDPPTTFLVDNWFGLRVTLAFG